MINVNEYYEGRVKSFGLDNEEGHVTVGVIEPGEYEFGTSTIEYMTVISGDMVVLLPGETDWKSFKPFQTFMVPKDTRFKVRTEKPAAYRCLYK